MKVSVVSGGILFVFSCFVISLDGSNVGKVTTFAGKGFSSYANGIGTNAAFNNLIDIIISTSYCFAADYSNKRVRYVRLSDQYTGLLAGSGSATAVNGVGTNVGFLSVSSIAVTSTESFLLVTDSVDKKIRKLTGMPTATATTFAGSGVNGVADGIGLSAQFKTPMGIGKLN